MKARRSRTKLDKMSPEALDASFPSARYFQVHFEYLHETINDLKQQVDQANQQIAELQQQLQPESLRDLGVASYAVETQPVNNLRRS